MQEKKERANESDIKTEYLVIGSNNFWYASEITLKNADATAKEILRDAGGFSDSETGYQPEKPETLYIYEAKEIRRI